MEDHSTNTTISKLAETTAWFNRGAASFAKKIKILFLILLLNFFLAACTVFKPPTLSREASDKVDNCAVGCPTGGSDITLTRQTHTLNNNGQTKFANWVAYKITKKTLGTGCRRTWRIDPSLNPNDTLAPSDYDGANSALQVDRGHQAPLASLCGLEGRDSLNYLSNITPQKSALNQGPWERLEDQERKLIRRDNVDAVYSVTGPLYEKFIGKLPRTMKEHTIPSGYWKVIFINNTPAVNHYAAFLFPQDASRQANFCNYQVTIAEIEKRTGLKIWPALPTEIQEPIKSILGLLPQQMGCMQHWQKSSTAERNGLSN